MAKATFYFPSDFRWGAVTAAYQRDEGIKNSEWWDRQPADTEPAANSQGATEERWENLEDALNWAVKMENNAIRLSLDWGQIEPEPSRFDPDVLNRYRAILGKAIDLGLRPMVTLHHFSTPRWLLEKGDFGSDLIVDYFRRYALQTAEALGDLVIDWLTFNEPLLYLVNRTLGEAFPVPRERGWRALKRAYRTMLACHAGAYRGIKSIAPLAQVGLAKHYRRIEASPEGNWLAKRQARALGRTLNQGLIDSLATGQIRKPFGRGTIDGLAGAFDFIGISYQGRSATPFGPWQRRVRNSYGRVWPVGEKPKLADFAAVGLLEAVKAFLRYEKPIYITGNGLPDASDTVRPTYLLSHLRELWRGITFSFPVMGYFHQSLVDGFEWDRGRNAGYGLVCPDSNSPEYGLRKGGRLYREICQSNAINDQMVAYYAPDLLASMFPGRSPQAPE